MKDRPMIASALLAALAATAASAGAEKPAKPPFLTHVKTPPQPDFIPLYDMAAPGSDAVTEPEVWSRIDDGQIILRNVSRPTITPFLPKRGKATGAAVLVFPGGGFNILAMSNEGWPVAQWLADRGIAAFLVKYRVNHTPPAEAEIHGWRELIMANPGGAEAGLPRAKADALQAFKLVKRRAAEWGVDPERIGMIGFSAGAMTTLATVLADDPDARPAFAGEIYGPMLSVAVPRNAPPLFTALALDDPLFGRQGFGIVEAWQKSGRPVEVHAYQKGGHGFGGMGKAGTSTTLLMPEFETWLNGFGFLDKAKARSAR